MVLVAMKMRIEKVENQAAPHEHLSRVEKLSNDLGWVTEKKAIEMPDKVDD